MRWDCLLSHVWLLRPHELGPARLLCPWNSTGKNTGLVCHFLLQGVFPTQDSNPGLLHSRQILYQLSCEGSSSVHGIFQARILEWVAVPFSSRSSQPRDQTQVSCIAGRFFTIWATSDSHRYHWCWVNFQAILSLKILNYKYIMPEYNLLSTINTHF